jgi:hypothetical protein
VGTRVAAAVAALSENDGIGRSPVADDYSREVANFFHSAAPRSEVTAPLGPSRWRGGRCA